MRGGELEHYLDPNRLITNEIPSATKAEATPKTTAGNTIGGPQTRALSTAVETNETPHAIRIYLAIFRII